MRMSAGLKHRRQEVRILRDPHLTNIVAMRQASTLVTGFNSR
jgi:hypothetical protein